jgi:cytochrome c oxidase assembly protein Cox11
MSRNPKRRKNLQVTMPCPASIAVMIGLVSYSPTIYRLFCSVTGYGGTTQRALAGSEETSDRTVTVLFDSNVAPGLPWRFKPEQREVTVHLGEQKLMFFRADGVGSGPIA